MTRRMILRLAVAVLLLWTVAGVLSWSLYNPAERLVGARTPSRTDTGSYVFAPRDLQPIAERVEKSYLWGLPPDGVEGKAKQQDVAEKVIEWRVLATRITGKERSLLVLIDKNKLEQIKEGEVLPDGSLVKAVTPNGYTLQSADGELVTTKLNF